MRPSMLVGGFSDLTPSFGYGLSGNGASAGNPGFVEMIGDQLSGSSGVSVGSIKTCLRRFPELKYHIAALATFVAYTNQFPWVNKDVAGPGGIAVKISQRLNDDEELIDLVEKALAVVREGVDPTELAAGPKPGINRNSNLRRDAELIRNLSKRLLDINDIYAQLYKAAQGLIQFSHCVVDYNESYSRITFYGLDELEKHVDQKTQKEVWIVKSTKKPLSDRFRMVTDGEELRDSPMGRVTHYLRVLETLETAMPVERLSKTNSFVVWKVGIDGLPGDAVPRWLDTYRDRVMNRFQAGVQNNNIVQASLSKSLTSSHIFIPNYKDSPTDVTSLNVDYRPLLTDLMYWWSKVFMSLGIPPYYALSGENGGSLQPSGDVASFHETLLGSRIRMYQGILEKELRYWLHQFITMNLAEFDIQRYDLSVSLPRYVAGGEESRSEYMRRINQFASAYSTLSVSGMPLNPKFAVQLMFPNADPEEVVDWEARKIMNPETTDPYDDGLYETDDATDEADIKNTMDLMSKGVTRPAMAADVQTTTAPDQYVDAGGGRLI